MRHFHRITTALSLLLLLTSAPPLAAQAEEDEPAQTPTDLAELLGPDLSEGVVYEYALQWGEATNNRTILQSRCELTEEEIIFTTRTSYFMLGQVTQNRGVYTVEGELTECESATKGYHTLSTAHRIERHGDDLQITQSRVTTPGRPPVITHEVMQETIPNNAIPDMWFNLALAYHIRESHNRFILHTYSDGSPYLNAYEVERIDGREHLLHGENVVVYELRMSWRAGETVGDSIEWELPVVITKLVLSDGTEVSSRYEDGDEIYTTESIDVEEAAAILTEANLPDLP